MMIPSQLSHRHIISFRGVCSDPSNLCIVMEFASKGTLSQVLKDSSIEIGPERIVDWAIQLAAGMDYLHTGAPKQIIHRDLKSGNILVRNSPISTQKYLLFT
jgi:serine/threonine protein kinase